MKRLRRWGYELALRELRDPSKPRWFRRLSNRVALRLDRGGEFHAEEVRRRYGEVVRTARGE